jgi:hypothetical protein
VDGSSSSPELLRRFQKPIAGPLMYKKAHTLNILPTSPMCIFLALFCAHFLFHSLALSLLALLVDVMLYLYSSATKERVNL